MALYEPEDVCEMIKDARKETLEMISQWLQENGFVEASMDIDCKFEL